MSLLQMEKECDYCIIPTTFASRITHTALCVCCKEVQPVRTHVRYTVAIVVDFICTEIHTGIMCGQCSPVMWTEGLVIYRETFKAFIDLFRERWLYDNVSPTNSCWKKLFTHRCHTCYTAMPKRCITCENCNYVYYCCELCKKKDSTRHNTLVCHHLIRNGCLRVNDLVMLP